MRLSSSVLFSLLSFLSLANAATILNNIYLVNAAAKNAQGKGSTAHHESSIPTTLIFLILLFGLVAEDPSQLLYGGV